MSFRGRSWIESPGGAQGCSHGWRSPTATGTRGARGSHGRAPEGRRRSWASGASAPSGAVSSLCALSTGSARSKTRLLHPWLQPFAPAGARDERPPRRNYGLFRRKGGLPPVSRKRMPGSGRAKTSGSESSAMDLFSFTWIAFSLRSPTYTITETVVALAASSRIPRRRRSSACNRRRLCEKKSQEHPLDSTQKTCVSFFPALVARPSGVVKASSTESGLGKA